MANSDSATLTALKTARDAVLTAIAGGELTVQVTVRGRTIQSSDPAMTLQRLEALIAIYTRKTRDAATSPLRVAKLSPAR